MANFVRVATSGKTIDGREISAEHLEQMAANYDPEKYGARIWLEHLRSFAPEGQFKAYGDVKALKTEKQGDKTVLLAELDPTSDLKAINKQRQKIFTSVEINTNFAGTGEAYLTGLAVTDSPASTGTEALKFNLQGEKADKNKLFSEFEEANLFVEDTPDTENPSGSILKKVKQLFTKADKSNADNQGAILHIAEETAKYAAQSGATQKTVEEQAETIKSLENDVKSLTSEFKTLKASLEGEPAGNPRPEGTGQTDDADVIC
jgi:hypothetical protein